MGTASLAIGIALIVIGVFVFINYDTTVTEVETLWGTGYRFATEEEQQDMLIGKFIFVFIFLIVGGLFLRKYDKNRKKEKTQNS